MKKINITLIILLSCSNINSYAQNSPHHIDNNSTSYDGLFVQQSALYIKKHALLIAITHIMIYYHKNIATFISNRPYVSSAALYLFLNYLCDSISSYQQQKSLLDIINLLKKTTLYLVISHGIKNHIHQKKVSIYRDIDEKIFLNNITADLPYSFDEVTLFALKSYQELKAVFQSLNITLNIESEEFVFLCHSSSINIQSLLYLVQNDPILYKAIYRFEKNPETHLDQLLERLKSEITKNFIDLEKHLSASNISRSIL